MARLSAEHVKLAGAIIGPYPAERPAQALVAAGAEIAPEGVAVGEVPPGGHDHLGGGVGCHLRQ